MKQKLLIAVLVLSVAAAAVGWVQAWRMQSRAIVAEEALQAQKRLGRASGDSYTTATFVRFDGSTLVYRLPRQNERDGQVFIDQVEMSSAVNDNVLVLGVEGNAGKGALLGLSEGVRLNMSVGASNTGGTMVNVVYVLP